MENPSNEPRRSIFGKWTTLPALAGGTLRIGIRMLVFGGIIILLVKLNLVADNVVDRVNSLNVDPVALAGGALILVVLTVIGVPLAPAAVAGVAVWYLVQNYL